MEAIPFSTLFAGIVRNIEKVSDPPGIDNQTLPFVPLPAV
jgi:hypothetical protein